MLIPRHLVTTAVEQEVQRELDSLLDTTANSIRLRSGDENSWLAPGLHDCTYRLQHFVNETSGLAVRIDRRHVGSSNSLGTVDARLDRPGCFARVAASILKTITHDRSVYNELEKTGNRIARQLEPLIHDIGDWRASGPEILFDEAEVVVEARFTHPVLSLIARPACYLIRVAADTGGLRKVRGVLTENVERKFSRRHLKDIRDYLSKDAYGQNLLHEWPCIKMPLRAHLPGIETAIETVSLPFEADQIAGRQRCSLLVMKVLLLARDIERGGEAELNWARELLAACHEELEESTVPTRQRLLRQLFFSLLLAEFEAGERHERHLQHVEELEGQLVRIGELDPRPGLRPLAVYTRVLKRLGDKPVLQPNSTLAAVDFLWFVSTASLEDLVAAMRLLGN